MLNNHRTASMRESDGYVTCDAEMRNIEKHDLLLKLQERQTANQQVCLLSLLTLGSKFGIS